MAKQKQDGAARAVDIAKVAAAAFQEKVDLIRARDGCDPAMAMLTAATEYSAELRAWNSADRTARSARRHIMAFPAPGAAGVTSWVMVTGTPGDWSPPGRAIYRQGLIEDAVNALIASSFTADLTVTEQQFDDDLASFPDSTAEHTELTILCPAIAGQPNRVWGFMSLEPDGSFRASPVVISTGRLPATLRDMAATTWAKPAPAIIRCLQVRPGWGLNEFGWQIVGGKVKPIEMAA